MEKSLKRQIVEATEAVKKKVRKMKDIEINNKEALESVLKPVTEPLNLIANVTKQTAPQNVEDEDIEVPFIDKTLGKEVLGEKESNDTDDYDSEVDSDSSFKSLIEKKQDCNTTSWSVSPEALADIPFGVRSERGKWMLGSAHIIVNDEYVIVAGRNDYWFESVKLNVKLVTEGAAGGLRVATHGAAGGPAAAAAGRVYAVQVHAHHHCYPIPS
ncbi:hypothetical protein HF086_007745 [Spodoptera exigua]|uniref:Uncharacterized protein n=1 Tax=Spodoptera exigua TaxID=7107 RepID=A0A922MME7_SPOEX|nr:hypothetical protein HF086_007745 [Spodoptera exigua]